MVLYNLTLFALSTIFVLFLKNLVDLYVYALILHIVGDVHISARVKKRYCPFLFMNMLCSTTGELSRRQTFNLHIMTITKALSSYQYNEVLYFPIRLLLGEHFATQLWHTVTVYCLALLTQHLLTEWVLTESED